jgi:sRNA-binding carbon storage regulator CsrA
MSLTVTRKVGEMISIEVETEEGRIDLALMIFAVSPTGAVKISIEAPTSAFIYREEIAPRFTRKMERLRAAFRRRIEWRRNQLTSGHQPQ